MEKILEKFRSQIEMPAAITDPSVQKLYITWEFIKHVVTKIGYYITLNAGLIAGIIELLRQI